ncbi:MAG: aspartate--ammonia ligase [Longibaculum muris]|uniref:Aspartate--ammonia ligase n=1 Tax=Longibaculum muris TaxID=1796628 RepID=A0A4R3Z654_9FIRM|nr:aspartate--ammonia ligase [Longibaculum muris]KXU50030.1 aspartate--ammonia ligase [Candidatus Stoquefichus sp. KLE1796]MBS5371200.1 aspartate--ammonia ligase [Coprobacillus cateniformis]MCR1887728.1 aspartate--ammonia ligase [Longibaculum muris]MED9812081.1 aspartate--ammonia ligase [Longibaculum muris]TCV99426.1 aspartate-ammonia ligase [Longibaculum muris]
MSKIIIPKGYHPQLNLIETEVAIKMIKDTFERRLAEQLRLTRVSAPLFLLKNTGLNDNLNGVEKPVSFTSFELNHDDEIEIIHSLAKWKRDALHRYGFERHTGLYTDMNAIRKDEELDNIHSMYVDQWDWEMVIAKEDRTMDYLKAIVSKIYNALLDVEFLMIRHYPQLGESILPDEIYFITSQELEDKYPNLTPKQRERAITKEKKAVCLLQIGDLLKSGHKHDNRAPDYDDWKLNADILIYNTQLDDALEISSMGIRVDDQALKEQLEKANANERLTLPYHQNIINHILPLSIGGGIGQSRLCMFFLRKAHIGEVQASLWDEETMRLCEENQIHLL